MATDAKELAAQIKTVSKDIDDLTSQVYDKFVISAEDSKRIPMYASQPLSFLPPDMALRESTFVNGAEDFSILGLTYTVTIDNIDRAYGHRGQRVYDTLFYPANNMVRASTDTYDGMDFEWNFRTKNGTSYLGAGATNSTGSPMLHRTALGFYEQGDFLRFSRPQVLRAGESLIFSVKPTFYPTTRQSSRRCTVHMICVGFRDGRMAYPTVRE